MSSDSLSVAPSVLAGLLESFPDGVLAVDDRWRLVYANSAGAALLQRPAAELVGRDLWAAAPELAARCCTASCCTPEARRSR